MNTVITADDFTPLFSWLARVPRRLGGFIWEAITVALRLIFERKPQPAPIEQPQEVEVIPEAALDETERETRSCVPVAGTIYLMRNEEGHCKLGYTTQRVNARRSQIVSTTGQKMDIVAAFESDAAWAVEKVLHSVFADKNISGEIFSLSDADIAMIPAIIEAANPKNIVKRVQAPKTVVCGACGASVEVS